MELKHYNLPVGAHVMVEDGDDVKIGANAFFRGTSTMVEFTARPLDSGMAL